METENLDRFLNIVGMFNHSVTNGDNIKGIVSHFSGYFFEQNPFAFIGLNEYFQEEMFLIIFASNSNTSESDWLKITSGDTSIWTRNEVRKIVVNLKKQKSTDDKWQLLKIAFRLRMNEEKANRIANILNEMREGATLNQFSNAMVSPK